MDMILPAMWEHDGALVTVALSVCLFGSYTALSLLDRHDEARGRARSTWLLGAGVAAGSAIWATHFIAMLSLDNVMPMQYQTAGTIASIAISILGSSLALSIATRGGTVERIIGGVLMGSAIAAMHFTGMKATTMGAYHHHAMPGVLTAIAVGCSASVAAMLARRNGNTACRFLATFFLAMSVATIHFGSMASMRMGAVMAHGVKVTDHGVFAATLAAVIAMLLLLAFVAAAVTGRMQAKDRTSAQRLKSLANLSLEGILVVDVGGVIVDVNDRMCMLLGDDPVGDALATHLPEVCDAIRAGNVGNTPIETDMDRADGIMLPVQAFIHKSSHVDKQAWVVVVRDLTERRAAEDQLRHVANHDPLTDLPNRALFMDRMDRALARTARSGEPTALLYIDLDGFKSVNDIKGHARGDDVLRHIARILAQNVRSIDTVARIGGDEFVIIQEGDQPAAAQASANRIIEEIARHYAQGRSDVVLGASIGIAIAPGDALDAGELMRLADVALYRAKADGKNQARFFEKSMDMAARDQRQIEADLRASIGKGEMSVAYQPQMNAKTGEIVGFEALARWTHPERGIVSPETFIPIAEQNGFIIQIGNWVMREACHAAASWRVPLRVAVNLSPVEIQKGNVVARILSALSSSGLSPDRLEIEITETAIMRDEKATIATLTQLKAIGVKISMDDFGTGYSSLSSLQSFPFDKIKVDKSFVSQIETDGKASSIVKAVIALGRSLNLPIVAEGVENERQLELLRHEECTEIQGYLIGRPLGIEHWSDITEGDVAKRRNA